MKHRGKRVFALALCLLLVCLTALPVLAAQEETPYYLEEIVYDAQVHTDGTISVTQALQVVYAEDNDGFTWQQYAGGGGAVSAVRDVQVSGELPAQVDQDDYRAQVEFGAAAAGRYQVTLRYTLACGDDYDPDIDYFDINLLGYGYDAPVQRFAATVRLPEGAVPHAAVVTRDLDAMTPHEDIALQQQDGVLTLAAQGLRAYTQAGLRMEFAEGTFTYPPGPPEEFSLLENTCSVALSTDMVYTVQHHVVLQSAGNDPYLNLPILEFEDYSTRCTVQLLESSGPMELKIRTYDGKEEVSAYLSGASAGVTTVDYSYQLRPVRLLTPIDLRVSLPYWASNMPKFRLEMQVPGMQTPRVNFYSVLRTPLEKRYTLSAQGEQLTLELQRALHKNESMVLNVPYDAQAYSRGVSGGELGVLALAAAMLLAVCVAKLLLGTGRRLQPKETTMPPEDINCAEFGYLLDGVAKNEELVTLVVQWAVQGSLTVESSAGEYIFHCEAPPAQAPQYEQEMFEALFACGQGGYVTTVQLRMLFAAQVSRARQGLFRRYRGALALRRFGAVQICAMLLAVLPAVVLCLAGMRAMGVGFAAVFGFVGAALAQACACGLCAVGFGAGAGALGKARIGNRGIRILCICALCLWEVLFALVLALLLPETTVWVIWLTLMLSMAACAVAGSFLQRSALLYGLLCRVLGFAAHLRAPGQPAAQQMQREDASYCYKLLPYAMQLGAEDAWLAAFAQEALPAPTFWKGVDSPAALPQQMRLLAQTLRSISVPGGY